jgi:hypothetical protein
MLPDFWAMIGARSPALRHDELAAGVHFHHVTDGAFHDAPTFRQLTQSAVASLLEAGLERGRARAVAHVGVEILLDAELAGDARARGAYREALAAATPDRAGRFITWADTTETARFDELVGRLAARGVAADDAGPELVAFRLERALAGRRRLALASADVEIVRRWAAGARRSVGSSAGALLAELELGLREVR